MLDFDTFEADSDINFQLVDDYGIIISTEELDSAIGPARVMDYGFGVPNAIIIQDSDVTDKTIWSDNGGEMHFTFQDGALLNEIHVLRDMDSEGNLHVTATYCDGTTNDLGATGFNNVYDANWIVTYTGHPDKYLVSLAVKSDTETEFGVTSMDYSICAGKCSDPRAITLAPVFAPSSPAPSNPPDFVCVDEKFMSGHDRYDRLALEDNSQGEL